VGTIGHEIGQGDSPQSPVEMTLKHLPKLLGKAVWESRTPAPLARNHLERALKRFKHLDNANHLRPTVKKISPGLPPAGGQKVPAPKIEGDLLQKGLGEVIKSGDF